MSSPVLPPAATPKQRLGTMSFARAKRVFLAWGAGRWMLSYELLVSCSCYRSKRPSVAKPCALDAILFIPTRRQLRALLLRLTSRSMLKPLSAPATPSSGDTRRHR